MLGEIDETVDLSRQVTAVLEPARWRACRLTAVKSPSAGVAVWNNSPSVIDSEPSSGVESPLDFLGWSPRSPVLQVMPTRDARPCRTRSCRSCGCQVPSCVPRTLKGRPTRWGRLSSRAGKLSDRVLAVLRSVRGPIPGPTAQSSAIRTIRRFRHRSPRRSASRLQRSRCGGSVRTASAVTGVRCLFRRAESKPLTNA